MARIEPDRQLAATAAGLRHHAATLRNGSAGPATNRRIATAAEYADEAAKLLDDERAGGAAAPGHIERFGR